MASKLVEFFTILLQQLQEFYYEKTYEHPVVKHWIRPLYQSKNGAPDYPPVLNPKSGQRTCPPDQTRNGTTDLSPCTIPPYMTAVMKWVELVKSLNNYEYNNLKLLKTFHFN